MQRVAVLQFACMEEKKKYKDPRYTDEGHENLRAYQKEFVRTHFTNGIDGLIQYLKNLIY